MGDVTSAAKTSGTYADYAKAIYQAINGDVAGGAYNAAIAFAGPIAAIGNAVANFLNKKGDIKSATTQALIDALQQADVLKLIEPRTSSYLVVGRCTLVRAMNEARAVSEAIRLEAPPDEVKRLFAAWMATGRPFTPTGIYSSMRKWCEPPYTLAPAVTTPVPEPIAPPPVMYVPPVPVVMIAPPIPAPAPVPTPTPTPMPMPTPTPAPSVTMIAPASILDSVPLPPVQSVPPDQTTALIAKMIADGASRDQAFNAAIASLAARRVPPTPQVQTMVARDITNASAPQMASTMWIVFAAAALFGVSLIFGSGSR